MQEDKLLQRRVTTNLLKSHLFLDESWHIVPHINNIWDIGARKVKQLQREKITKQGRNYKLVFDFHIDLPSSVSFGIAEYRFFLASETRPYITSAISAPRAEVLLNSEKFLSQNICFTENKRESISAFDCGT